MADGLNSRIRLNDGVEIPVLGYGTYKLSGKDAYEGVKSALETGYRLIDTAENYGNEKEVGKAINESGITRSEIFVTTKLANDKHGRDKTLAAFDESLENLNLHYVDLFLIHWPASDKVAETYKAMQDIFEEGRVKAIGVSNFTINHLKLLKEETSVTPTVNQVEFHPFCFQPDILEYCNKNNIVIQAYSPIARAKKMDNKTIQNLAGKYKKTPAQVMIRWAMQHGTIPVPKSSNPERIKENSQVFDFEISDKDMKELDKLDENFRIAPDPHQKKFKGI